MAVLAPNYKPWVDGHIRKKPFVLPIPFLAISITLHMTPDRIYHISEISILLN